MAAGAPMLDSKSIPKADSFNGKVEDWSEWKFSFRYYAYLLGLIADIGRDVGTTRAAEDG